MNFKKKLAISVGLTGLSLTTFVGGVYAGTTYIDWAGTPAYRQAIENIGLFEERGNQLVEDKDALIVERDNLITEYEQIQAENEETGRENEQLNNQILDLENQINSLEQQITALEDRIADGQTTRDQLDQAAKDMNHVEERSSEVLEGLE